MLAYRPELIALSLVVVEFQECPVIDPSANGPAELGEMFVR